jgi:hypothetical protein
MRTLTIKTTREQPEDLILYPDFAITSMLETGPCLLEADYTVQKDGVVPFTLTDRKTGSRSVAARVPTTHFRPALARFAVFCGLENLYGGQVLFSCDFEREGAMRPHRFSLFLCNEPTMAFWLRLYLYGIDGVFPSLKKT